MGHNIEGRSIITGDFVIGIERRCSENLWDMFDKYHVSPKIWNRHSSAVLLHNINQAIAAIIKDNARYVTHGVNPNFYGGLRGDNNQMQGQERLDMFFTWLRYWRNVVEQHPKLRWFSDQVCEVTPYNTAGVESDGEYFKNTTKID